MQNPPERRVPTVLFTRATSEWIARVNQKHKELADLHLATGQRESLDRWAETEFLYATLRLKGVDLTKAQLKELVSAQVIPSDQTADNRAAAGLLASLRTIVVLTRDKGKAALLTRDLLLNIHDQTGLTNGFRKGAGDARRLKPASAGSLPVLIDNACQWYTADSFTELHPIEQASIVFLRLIEMQPFEEANERTALVAGSLFTLRSELPPIIINHEMGAAYRAALDEGIRMNTKPMVELIAEAVQKSLSSMLELAKS